METSNFGAAEVDGMKAIEKAIIAALLPFRSRMPNGLAVFALVRCARVMLRLSPPAAQAQMLDAIVPYLEGKMQPREGSDRAILHLPTAA